MTHHVPFAGTATFVPSGHSGVLNHMMLGRAEGAIDDVSVWHGTFEPGGSATMHVHDDERQIYIALSGALVTGTASVEVELGPLDAFAIPAGERHFIENRSQEVATLLVISTPALR